MPPDIADDIVKKTLEHTHDQSIANYVKKLQITLEERLTNSGEPVRFIIPKSNIIRYAKQGEIYYSNIPFTLTIEQRQKHIAHIVSVMRKNPHIQLIVYDDVEEDPSSQEHNISVYYSKRYMLLKKNGYLPECQNVDLYSSVLSSSFLNQFNDFFDNLCQSNLCTTLSPDDIEEIVNKYEYMFLRISEV